MSDRHFVYWQERQEMHFRCGDYTGSDPLDGRLLDEAADEVCERLKVTSRERLDGPERWAKELNPAYLREVQNACNPVAVALLLGRVAKALHAREDTNQVATRPAFRAVLLKLCDMAGIDHSLSNYSGEGIEPFLYESDEHPEREHPEREHPEGDVL